MTQPDTAPVCLLVFNRPWHTARTLAALAANEGAGGTRLIVFADGPRDEKDEDGVGAVRRVVREAAGFGGVHIIERDHNVGLAESVISGVGEVLSHHRRCIVLEDDIVTSPAFLQYMNTALREYETDERVGSIHGYVYPVGETLPDTFFLRGADCWGWATWRSVWATAEWDGGVLLRELRQRRLGSRFDLDGAYPYTRMLRDQIRGRNSSWAIRWHASLFLQGRLTLFPGRSLVQNIGTDSSGTHSANTNQYSVDVSETAPEVGDIPVEESVRAREAFKRYHRGRRGTVGRRLMRGLRRAVRAGR